MKPFSNNNENQTSVQEEIFRSLLRTPHKKPDETMALHKEQYARDPNFYAKVAVYAVMHDGCAIRDVNEIFIAQLFASEYRELREAAYVMLQSMPPYQVYRIMRYVTGYKERRSYRSFDPPISGPGVTVRNLKSKIINLSRCPKLKKRLINMKKISRTCTQFTVYQQEVAHEGFGMRKVRGELKRAIRDYLRFRENPDRRYSLETGLMRMKEAFRALYARTNTLPGGSENSWINRYLFNNEVKEGSRLAALRQLATTNDPIVKAELIIKNKIPYPIAITFLKNITPSVLIAMIESMTLQELMANMKLLVRRGATSDPQVKLLIEQKLQKAKTAKNARIDALKGAFAASQVEGLDQDIAQIMTEVTDSQLKQHGTIKSSTAMLIDKSASMEQSIALALEIGAVLAQACENLRIYTFDTIPTEIKIIGDAKTRSAWESALKMVRASGGTEPHTVIRKMINEKIQVDQLLLITDENENPPYGRFANEIIEYEKVFGYTPMIVIVRIGGSQYGVSNRIEKTCKAKGLKVDVMRCEEIDKIAIPNLLKLLSRKSVFELVQEILSLPLPNKQEWKKHQIMSARKTDTI